MAKKTKAFGIGLLTLAIFVYLIGWIAPYWAGSPQDQILAQLKMMNYTLTAMFLVLWGLTIHILQKE